MRRVLAFTTAAFLLLGVGVASAGTQTINSGADTATLSWSGAVGPRLSNLTLTITDDSTSATVFAAPVRSSACFGVCLPNGKYAVEWADFGASTAPLDVVLNLWTGGADCCELYQVFYPSGSSYAMAQHNFGSAGAKVSDLGRASLAFRSADNAFYCTFTSCAASGMPIQIWAFSGTSFVNVTRRYPKLVAADGSGWWTLYRTHVGTGAGLLAAWAADEDSLGRTSTVSRRLVTLVRERHITAGFVRRLTRFLTRHGYLR